MQNARQKMALLLTSLYAIERERGKKTVWRFIRFHVNKSKYASLKTFSIANRKSVKILWYQCENVTEHDLLTQILKENEKTYEVVIKCICY